jgi:hypothetical protein
MQLFIERDDCQPMRTFGRMSINGVPFCETLEDTDRRMEDGGAKVAAKTCIPRGLYPVVLDYSQRFGQIMPHVLDVDGFAGIRIHPGNTEADTEGCILVGRSRGIDRITQSRVTYERLMILLEDAIARGELITLEVR